MSEAAIDESVIPRWFKSASLEDQALHLASALISVTCVPSPSTGTFGYEWMQTARYFHQQRRDS